MAKLSTHLWREALWIASSIPTPPFQATRPSPLMRKHSDLLHKGIRNSKPFFHTYEPPEGCKPTTKYHVIKVLMSQCKFVILVSSGEKSGNGWKQIFPYTSQRTVVPCNLNLAASWMRVGRQLHAPAYLTPKKELRLQSRSRNTG